MKLINRLGPCRGYVLWSFFGWTVELWRIPPLYQVPEHSHPNIDNWIVYLKGDAFVNKFLGLTKSWVEVNTLFVSPGKLFHIRPNELHKISNGGYSLWLLTIQKWLDPHSLPISVSEDITFKT